jgi:hypothetical protein
MRRVIGTLLVVVVLGLWVGNSVHTQTSVRPDDVTAQAQLTAVAKPVPSPTR